MTVKERELPGPGWARNPMGFIVNLERGSLMPFCQKTVTRRGEREACGRNPEYARTMWDAGVVFACGRHLADMENYARPLRSVNSNGDPVVIISGERMARPTGLLVRGGPDQERAREGGLGRRPAAGPVALAGTDRDGAG